MATTVEKLIAAEAKLKAQQKAHADVCKPIYKDIAKLKKQLIEEALTANKPKT